MEKQYYIALYLIGVKNKILIDIMNTTPKEELKKLFKGNLYEFEFKYNLDLKKYSESLNNKKLMNEKLNEAKKILSINKELKIRTILFKEKMYPNRLKDLKDPPAIIYLKGSNFNKQDLRSVACVGSRKISEFGKSAIESIVANLTKEKFTIISGLAYGVDKTAHETCLNNNGKTVAVLAHGLDTLYPKEHQDLAQRILENGGTLITEYPVGTKADKFRFVARNRIISALSAGVVMIEAKEKSGTNHTINFAIECNRPIFVPLPSEKKLENGLNFKLLDENKAFPVKVKNDYSLIVEQLGYKIKYDKKIIANKKNNSLDKVILRLTEKGITPDITKLALNNARTGFDVNKEDYEKFKKILKENDLSIKEFFNVIVNLVVNTYERGDK